MGGRKPARMRCGECEFCLREDCGTCVQCVQKKKFGGAGTSKQACLHRRCINLQDRSSYKTVATTAGTITMSSSVSSSTKSTTTEKAANNNALTSGTQLAPASTAKTAAKVAPSTTATVPKTKPKLWSTSSSASSILVGASTSTATNTSNHYHGNPGTAPALRSPLPVMACPSSASSSRSGKQHPSSSSNTQHSQQQQQQHPNQSVPTITHMYGLPIPVFEKKDMCAGCGGARDEEAKNEPILLCDGKGCGCEFHLKCCIPPLQEVPLGSFYCFDCSPEGTTSLLRQYLQEHEEQRLQYPNAQSFLQALWEKDLKEEEDEDDREGEDDEGEDLKQQDDEVDQAEGNNDAVPTPKKGTPKKSVSGNQNNKKRKRSKPTRRIPESEVNRAVAIHALALGPLPRMRQHQQLLQQQEQEISPQDRRAADKNIDHATIENNNLLSPTSRLLIGKPVKLYCPLGNGYHNGRIVSARRRNIWKLPDLDNDEENINTEDVKPAAVTTDSPDGIDEYLVRFSAGLDGRKSTLYYWVVLEEHSLAVATTLIWGDFGNKTGYKGFKPGRIWVRTTRELLPVRHLLREDQGQVVYMDAGKSINSRSKSTSNSNAKKNLCWGLAQCFGEFGDDGFKVLHLQNNATDLFSTTMAYLMSNPSQQQQASKPSRASRSGSKTTTSETAHASAAAPTANSPMVATLDSTSAATRMRDLEYTQACAEWEEQKRVYEWSQRRLENPGMEKALSCLDEQRLGPLNFAPPPLGKGGKETKGNKVMMMVEANRYHADLVPLIPRGLDRHFILKILERNCNVIGTKDVAASLTCQHVISIPAALQSMRDKDRERLAAKTQSK